MKNTPPGFGYVWFVLTFVASFALYGTQNLHGGPFVAEVVVSALVAYCASWAVVALLPGPWRDNNI